VPLPEILAGRLSVPVIGAPLFIVSGPELVIAQCQAGIVGSFPALNARPKELLEEWIVRIKTALAAWDRAHPDRPAAPFAVNQIAHASNDRLEHDVAVCVKHRVPITITSLRAPSDIVSAVHGYGGIVLHDVVSVRHAEKAVGEGVDGLILVCAGAGGHAGPLSPFALLQEVRAWYDGPLALSGAIATGAAVLAALALGADLAYVGTRFVASAEAHAKPEYKRMLIESTARDIVLTRRFTGIPANYLRGSIEASGLDPDALPDTDAPRTDFGSGSDIAAKAWRDIWGAGQGVGAIRDAPPAAEIVARLAREMGAAREALAARLT
jgi:nitronate monooxygenase